jgi:Cupredoxin-like domain
MVSRALSSGAAVMRDSFYRLWALALATSVMALGWLVAGAHAEDRATFTVILENDAFGPTEIKVPAGAAFILKVVNNEKSGVEIEAKDLKIEKVAAAGTEIVARVKALKQGKYLLVNEYKEDTVKAYIVAE